MSESIVTRPAPPAVPGAGAVAPRRSLLRPLVAGAVSVLAAIGASELVAGFLGGPSLLAGVGEWVINHQPPGAKDLVVGLFGTNDKLALETLILAVAVAADLPPAGGHDRGRVQRHRRGGAADPRRRRGRSRRLGHGRRGAGRDPVARGDCLAAGRRRDRPGGDQPARRPERPVLPDRH